MSLKAHIEKDTSKCVKCGLCATVCPTYALTKQEGESPRGRIALMEGLAQNKLAIDQSLVNYLDHCLTCRACESICPAEVPYSSLINTTKFLINKENSTLRSKHRISNFLFKLLQQPIWSKLLAYFLYFYQFTGIQALMRKSGALKLMQLENYDAVIPKLASPAKFKAFYSPQNSHQGNIALFINCINPVLEPATINAAIQLLTKMGYGVYIPSQQTCCGGLALHQGDKDSVYQLLQKNIAAFSNDNILHIISFSSGCSLTLQEHQRLFDNANVKPFSKQVVNIYQFLLLGSWPKNISFVPLPKKILLHHPCTLKNGLGEAKIAQQLLNKIPELTIIDVPSSISCCGAAGEYFLQYPVTANKLLQPIIDYAQKMQPDYFITSNVGCHLHVARGLKKIPTLHPLTLLANQLQIKG